MAKIPESAPKFTFAIRDFSGGLVNNVNDVKMADKESPDMLNMMFRNDGLLQKRPGSIFIKKFRYPCDNIFIVEPTPNKYNYVISDSTAIYFVDGEDYYLIKTLDRPVLDGCQFMDKFFFVDGEGAYYYDLKQKRTYRLVNPPANFVPAPKPSVVGVVKEKLIDGHFYETWYEPCEFEMEDGYKGTSIVPSNPTMVVANKDRLYFSGNVLDPNMVYISDILQPIYYPASLPVQTPPTDDLITSLKVFNNCIIIGRRDSIYALFGNTNRDDSIDQYVLSRINSHTGMINNYSSDLVHTMMFFVGSDGNLYKLNVPSNNSNVLYTVQLNTKLDLKKYPFDMLIDDDIRRAHTSFDSVNNLWYIQLSDQTLVYNYALRAFTRYDNINAMKFISYNNQFEFTRFDGSIYRFASPYETQKFYDDYYDWYSNKTLQLPVYAYWTSRNMDFGNPALVKKLRDVYITSESFEENDTTINVKFEVDYIDVNKEFVVENEIAKWNKAVWDKHKFTSRNIDRSLPIMLNRRGRTLKLSFGCGYRFSKSVDTMPKPSDVEEYELVYVIDEGMMYLRTPYREGFDNLKDKYFREFPPSELNQALLVHNIVGMYQNKGYR